MAGSFNYDSQLADIEQRQKIADALASGSLAPLQGVSAGGMYAAPHWTEALGKVLQAYAASKGREQIKSDRTALADKYNTELAKGAENFYRTSEGYSEPSLARTPNADGTPQTVSVPGNPRKAIFDALASGHPVLQQMAMQQLAAQQKGVVTLEKLSALATPESVLANPNNPAKWVPKRELKGMQPGEVLIDAAGNIATPGAGATGGQPSTSAPGGTPSGQGWDTISIGGDLYQRTATGLKKLDNAPKVAVSMNPVIQGQKAGMSEYFKGAAEQVKALGERARQASDIKQTLTELQALDQQGIFSNVTTGPATFLSNLGQAAGVKVDTSKLGNTEAFNALTTDLWQGLISKFGGNRGVTQQEAAEIKKMLPLAASSPQARQTLYILLNNVADRQIKQFGAANKSFAQAALSEDPTKFSEGFGETYLPEPVAPTPVIPGRAGAVRRFNPATGRIE